MRSLAIAFFFTLLTASIAMAGFSLKSGVYRMSEMESAKAEARATGKPIAFLYSDENTTCPLCAGSSQYAMDALAESCLMVYADEKDWAKLPKKVRAAIRAPEAGKYIPTIIVMSSDLEKVIVIVPYVRGDAYYNLIAEARIKISQ